MPLLSHHRRYMGAMIVGIFALLLLSNLIPDPLGRFTWRSALRPELGYGHMISVAFNNVGEFIQDNFGFRASLPVLRRELRAELDSPDTRPIYTGRTGQLFWGRENSPEQSAGALVRVAGVRRFAEMIGEMNAILSVRGAKLVVALPPNAQSVDLEGLPEWHERLAYKTTEYDLMLGAMEALGVTAVDLRAALRKTPYPRYLLTDTHWNFRSSVAAFNAAVTAAGHPEWALDLSRAIGAQRPVPPGDLLRSMRMPPQIQDHNFTLNVPLRKFAPDPRLPHHNVFRPFASTVFPYGGGGPRVLVMGDSFSALVWPRLFMNSNVSEVGWMHASRQVLGSCDFNFDNLLRFKPDIVIYARGERFFTCAPGAWPRNLPRPDAALRAKVAAAVPDVP